MRILRMVIFCAAVGVSSAHGQRVGTQATKPAKEPTPPEKSIPARKAIPPHVNFSMTASCAEEIKEARPDITDELLAGDEDVVQASIPALRRTFLNRGFASLDADQAALEAWKQIRINKLKPTVAMSSKSLIDEANGFGKLIINSTPDGAWIEIDQKVDPDPTELVKWLTPGPYRIRLGLDGYEPVEDTCLVKEGKLTTFNRTLKKISKPQ